MALDSEVEGDGIEAAGLRLEWSGVRTVTQEAMRYFFVLVYFSLEVTQYIYYLHIKRRADIFFPLPRAGRPPETKRPSMVLRTPYPA